MYIQVEVFWIVTTCCIAVEYQCFGVPCYLNIHFTLKIEEAWASERLVSYNNTTQPKRPRFESSPPREPQISIFI
jgi:hypothetical protein